MNYYKRWSGDYMRDTAHLSLIEHGAYTLLLDVYYATERPLPSDKTQLYRIAHAVTPAEKKAVDSVIRQFFVIDGDLCRNPRADKEIANDAHRIASARENGARGGRRKKNGSENPDSKPNITEQEPSRFSFGNPDGTETEPSGQALQRQRQERLHPDSASLRQDVSEVSGGGDSLPPESPYQDLTTGTTRAREAKPEPTSAAAWRAYAMAHQRRYGVEPVRNAKTNALLCQLVKRLGEQEAPAVAAHYVTSNSLTYVRARHCLDLLVRDAEGLRTEWATGRAVTDTEARQADRRQSNANAFAPLLAEADAREKQRNG